MFVTYNIPICHAELKSIPLGFFLNIENKFLYFLSFCLFKLEAMVITMSDLSIYFNAQAQKS